MDRRTQEHYKRVLDRARTLSYLNRLRPSLHGRQRETQRAIEFADAEATILGPDARVVGRNPNHPEGVTYIIAGRRADGDEIRVVVAFDAADVEAAREVRVVTVMHPT